jgi:hypothetical protein
MLVDVAFHSPRSCERVSKARLVKSRSLASRFSFSFITLSLPEVYSIAVSLTNCAVLLSINCLLIILTWMTLTKPSLSLRLTALN